MTTPSASTSARAPSRACCFASATTAARVAGQALRAHPPTRPDDAGAEGRDGVLADAGLRLDDIDYLATTGEGENVTFATGHFYSMTTHARGGVFLNPTRNAVVDIGALNGRAIYVDERGKVLSYKMTSQCASGSGQFLENIARYLGVAVEEIGPLSQTSTNPEKCSSICAVLAETDVINMVSRGIPTPDVLKGIHLSMASRIVKLLKVTGIKQGTALITGGLALDTGLLAAIQEEMVNEKVSVNAVNHPDSIYAGAIGAALWGAFRHAKLKALASRRPPNRRGEPHHGPAHRRQLHRLRRLQAGVPERRHHRRRSDLRHRPVPLHRVCRRRGRAAVPAGLPGRLHPRQPGVPGDAGGADGQVRVAARLSSSAGRAPGRDTAPGRMLRGFHEGAAMHITGSARRTVARAAVLIGLVPFGASVAAAPPDPCTLITAAELQQIAGVVKGNPNRSGGAGAVSCEFTLAKADAWVEISLHDGELAYWKKRNGGKAPLALPEFGSEAFVNPDFEGSADLYAKKDKLVLRVSMPKGPGSVETVKAIARKAMARL